MPGVVSLLFSNGALRNQILKEQLMSAINGDKARFHRKRKAGIARRARNRQRLESAQGKVASVAGSEKKGQNA
ncbi:MAG TPA: hypothetical protein VF133_03260 [Terriglobales bacterium]